MMADDDAWLDDKDAQERAAKLVLDQMALALRNLAPNHWLMPVFTAIICVMFWRWIAPARLIGWFAAVTLSVIPLAVATSMFRRHMPNVRHWKNWVINQVQRLNSPNSSKRLPKPTPGFQRQNVACRSFLSEIFLNLTA